MTIAAIGSPLLLGTPAISTSDGSSITMNAAGESVSVIGRVRLEGGSGSKTFSSSGGKIYFFSGVTTFANAGTTVRIGVQDVDLTTGLEDGTFDVYDDLVGGTDTINTAVFNTATMSSGSRSITHGDVLAIVIEMTARGGADSVQGRRQSHPNAAGLGFPYGTADTGTLAKSTGMLVALIEFDDGTIGWIDGNEVNPTQFILQQTFNSGSTPDEYAAVFTMLVPVQVSGIVMYVTGVASGDTFELILYSDPLGTPAVIEAVAPDEDLIGSLEGFYMVPITPVTLQAGSTYGVALRPTSANDIVMDYVDYTTGYNKVKRTFPFFGETKLCSRSNQSGAFSEVQTYYQPQFALQVTGLDDGTGGGFAVVTSQEPVILSAIPVGY